MYRIAVLCGLQPTALTNELLAGAHVPEDSNRPRPHQPDRVCSATAGCSRAERSLAAATARIGIETADLFPRVTFNGSLALEASSFAGLTHRAQTPTTLVRASGGPRSISVACGNALKPSTPERNKHLPLTNKRCLLALEETENALVALSRERRRFVYLTEAERSAAEAVQLARQRYRDGIADYLSVLDAERTLLNLQEQLVTAQTLTVTRLIAVYKALGGGVPVRKSVLDSMKFQLRVSFW